MKFYEPDEIPPGRFCTLCERFIDDTTEMTFVSDGYGTETYLTKNGLVHTLLSEKKSNTKRKQLYPQKPETTLPPMNELVATVLRILSEPSESQQLWK